MANEGGINVEKIVFGISVILFGIALILTSNGEATAGGLACSFIGLAISTSGFINTNKK
jgi:hypothetical protein